MGNIILKSKKLGKTEVGWWIAHNNKNYDLLARLLTQNFMLLYSLPENEATKLLPYLMGALKGHDERNWDRAITGMTNFYKLIKEKTKLKLNPDQAARLEVGWWKLHDKLEFEPNKLLLAENFSKLYSEIFSIDESKLKNAGILRAWATWEHDLAEDPDTTAKAVKRHWKNVEKLLTDFYYELLNNIRS